MEHGFVKIAAAVPTVSLTDCMENARSITDMAREAAGSGAAVTLFPELSVTGYTCGDLIAQPFILEKAEQALGHIVDASADISTVIVAGLPVAEGGRLYNCAAVVSGGELLGLVPKTYIPNYDEFYEKRWFSGGGSFDSRHTVGILGRRVPMSTRLLFGNGQCCFAVEICEDLWAPLPPSTMHAVAGASIILNLSASNELAGKHDYLHALISQQSARTISGYVYASAGWGESSTDTVFAGNGIIAENGRIAATTTRFSKEPRMALYELDTQLLDHHRRKTDTFAIEGALPEYKTIPLDLPAADISERSCRTFDPHPFLPKDAASMDERCTEIFDIQVAGLARRLEHTASRSLVVGISGGLDSTLALLVAVRACDFLGLGHEVVTAVTMPGFGTTDHTYGNAVELMRQLGVRVKEIDIRPACRQHFADIGLPDSDRSITFENAQARERTQILMDIANMEGGLVVGTGDLSELALGWATYNGDIMSMYGVNAGVPKTLVRHLVTWFAASQPAPIRVCLLDIADTPISPELLPADEKGEIRQKTEDHVGPYELHDYFIYNFLHNGYGPRKLYFTARLAFGERYDKETIAKWLVSFFCRFITQQFKRSALPDGPKVGSVGLSPRGDLRMPSDASARAWIEEAESILRGE